MDSNAFEKDMVERRNENKQTNKQTNKERGTFNGSIERQAKVGGAGSIPSRFKAD